MSTVSQIQIPTRGVVCTYFHEGTVVSVRSPGPFSLLVFLYVPCIWR